MHLFFVIVCALAISGVVIGPADVRSHLPEHLQHVIECRKAQTSQIEWTISYLQGRDAGLVERHITRTVGDTIWQVNLGNENGYHRMAFSHLPSDDSEEALRKAAIPEEEEAGPRHSLVHDGHVWHVDHHQVKGPHLVGYAIPVEHASSYHPFDFRAAGIGPWWYKHNADILGLRRDLLEGFDAATYTVTSGRNMEIITGEFNGKTIEWHLDKNRGSYPVHAAFYNGDDLLNSSHTDLTEIDGRWFPSSVRFYRGDDQQPYKVIDVQKASFDEARHTWEIIPDDIGVLFGTQLWGYPGRPHRWDGTRIITGEEYDELIYIYGVRPDPIITEKLAKAMGQTVEEYLQQMDKTMEQWRERYLKEHGEEPWVVKKSEAPDEWDLYVAEFIKKHNLDEPRVKRANELLGRAKKLRDYHKRKNRSEIRKAKEEGNTEKVARYEAVTERIFKRVLVRGLNKLIPREQRRAG